MKPQSQFKRVMSKLITFMVILVVTYGFLSLVNWSPSLKDWTGFSRFILGAEGLVCLIAIWDEL